MKSITDLVVRLADLAEAEGRTLRTVAVRLGVGAGLFVGAMAMVLAGISLVLVGVHEWLTEAFGRPGAFVIVGLIFIILAVICAWIARSKTPS